MKCEEQRQLCFDTNSIWQFAQKLTGKPASLKMRLEPLSGGLQNCGIAKVSLTWRSEQVESRSQTVVAKLVDGFAERELAIYEALRSSPAVEAMPRLLATERTASGQRCIFLEYVQQDETWPWRNAVASLKVLQQLAKVHEVRGSALAAVKDWDYDPELVGSAGSTVELFASAMQQGFAFGDRPMLRALERVADTLPAMRTALNIGSAPVLLHGGAHAGNAAIVNNGSRAVLLDWGRARLGSPLEDVSSWLQSVGYWDPEVKRRHDTLFRSYLRARGFSDQLTPELRQRYWLAAACNAMAGALRYHLATAIDPSRGECERGPAAAAVRDWLRIIRRADASWRN